MGKPYRARLLARNEVVEYRDEFDTYWFYVALVDKTWILYLPGSRGDKSAVHELDAEEQRRVLPRLTEYLSGIKWFWLYGGPYSVEIRRQKT
jgi:hypothetical protein